MPMLLPPRGRLCSSGLWTLDFGLWSSYFAVTYIHRAHKAHVECREKALRTKTTNKVELRPPLARLGN